MIDRDRLTLVFHDSWIFLWQHLEAEHFAVLTSQSYYQAVEKQVTKIKDT